MPAKLIASYRRELSALADLQDAGTVTYTLLREADAYCIRAQRDTAPAVSAWCVIQGRNASGCSHVFCMKMRWNPRRCPLSCTTSADRRWADGGTVA